MTDAMFVRKAQQGDEAAYEALVRRHETVAFRTAWLILGNTDDARDATQNGFLKAWLAIRQVDPARPFQPWLLTIIANEARNRRRARARWLDRFVALGRDDLLAEPGSLPEQEAERRDEAGMVLRHLAAMEEADRLTLWCRYVLELGERETADVMGCAVGTVKSRTHRALGRLRERLRDTPVPVASEEGERDA